MKKNKIGYACNYSGGIFKDLRLWFIVLIFMSSGFMYGQSTRPWKLYARVFDSFTYQKVDSVSVEIMDRDSTVLHRLLKGDAVRYGWWNYYDSIGFSGKRIVRFMSPGYDDVYVDVNFRFNRLFKSSHDFGIIEMHKSLANVIKLEQVNVNATLVKMVVKGDTVVYNAAAFQLSSGSMLDKLVAMLPGTEIRQNGEIFVNGKKINSLLVNGEEFFKGNPRIALENLPAYMVDKIKVYEKQPDMEIALGENKKMHKTYPLVMDVNLKKQYSIGWIANAEGGFGTDNHYLGRAFGLRFSNQSRLTLFANSNDINDKSYSDSRGMWQSGSNQDGETRSLFGGADFLLNDKKKRFKLSSNLLAGHNSTDNSEHSSTINFFDEGSVYSRSRSMSENKELSIESKNKLDLTNNKNAFFSIKPNVTYKNYERSMYSSSADFDRLLPENFIPGYLDSLFTAGSLAQYREMLLNGTQNSYGSEGHNLQASFSANGTLSFKNVSGKLNLFGRAGYRDQENRDLRHSTNSTGNSTGIAEEVRFKGADNKVLDYSFSADYLQVMNLFTLNRSYIYVRPFYSFTHSYSDSDRPYYILDDADYVGGIPSSDKMILQYLDVLNSSRTSRWTDEHKGALNISFEHVDFTDGKEDWNRLKQWTAELDLPFRFVTEKLDYSRGTADTVARRNKLHFEPYLKLKYERKYNDTDRKSIELSYKLYSSAPDLIYGAGYYDGTDPLTVREGNSDLSDSRTHDARLSYRFMKNTSKGRYRNIYADLNYVLWEDLLCQSMTYNVRTGVRTYKPNTINGNWRINSSFTYDQPSSSVKTFGFRTRTGLGYRNSADYISLSGTENSTKNTVRTISASEDLYATYQFVGGNVHANFRVDYSNMQSDRFKAMNLFNYNYGLGGSYFMRQLDMNISTDLYVTSRRGYEDGSFNTNEFVWNASIDKSILNGRLTFRLKAYDILNQISSVQYVVNAQMQREMWRNKLGRYVMLSVMYKLNIEPKKK